MSGYDPDERIHPPAPSFLSRPPTRAERRRLRRLLAGMPPPPELVFWPESTAIDGPWAAGAHRPEAPAAPVHARASDHFPLAARAAGRFRPAQPAPMRAKSGRWNGTDDGGTTNVPPHR